MKEKAIDIFRREGGTLRMSDALTLGINRAQLYALRDSGELECISRGLYRLRELPEPSDLDLLTVSSRCPEGVLCLISALAYHDITTQIPHSVSIAVLRGSWRPKIDFPPVDYYQFSKKAYEAGIETHKIDGMDVKVYCMEKTLVDCFKYRNKIGLDVVLEALKMYKFKRKLQVDKLIEYAQLCRVEKVIMPYLEASL
ncbi:type IV toxin-antitoxin system AbiEi family antitoxin domain-containing protein [Lentisphaera marina]|uniref:type IV toxin-antitoxin system AbiEi family antitoxin domain-containing protein n=1 Tax=Lentisphaera marina TaxID=1111041 RepID=UPI002366C06D|nr:type IV toxin-antitoxin system AbiEi family antitoxin domain-containing protein [Lentisphaera marina]MDD7986670.1 type IV toxin-antitoxin system AbiEi family antitoxin domain-containing protein [Lentisphaera marina]